MAAGGDCGCDGLVPVWQKARNGVLQALGQWHLARREHPVARVTAGISRVGRVERWRRDVVAAAPQQNLLVSETRGGFGLVQALERAVVTLVETPVRVHRYPHSVHYIQRDPQGADGSLKHGGIGEIEFEPRAAHRVAGFSRLGDSLLGEIDIGPSGEAVFPVPHAFAMTQQNKLFHRVLASPPSLSTALILAGRRSSALRCHRFALLSSRHHSSPVARLPP